MPLSGMTMMKLTRIDVALTNFRSFSFRFRKLATTSFLVIATFSSGPLWANPLAKPSTVDRSTYLTVIGSRLGNSSDTSSVDAKLGDLQPLKPGGDASFTAITMGQRIDTHWDWKVSTQSTLTEDATSSFSFQDPIDFHQWASNSLRISTGDFELGYLPDLLPNSAIRFFGGARVVRAENSISKTSHVLFTTEQLGEIGLPNDDVAQIIEDKIGSSTILDLNNSYARTNEVKAIGPRLGMNAEIPLGDNGPRLVTTVSGSVLFGTSDSNYESAINGSALGQPVVDETSGSYAQDKKLTNLEASIGLQFDLSPDATIEFGYRAQAWGGLLNYDNNPSWIADTVTQGGSTDVKFQGPYLALTWKFGS